MEYSDIEEVFCLTDDRKYEAFFKNVSESEVIYGIKNKEKWIITKDRDGNTAMPIWPGYGFARYCQENQWKDTEIEGIDLYEFIEYWLSGMKRDGCKVLVFGDTGGGGISVDADKLKAELEKYLQD